MESSNCLSGLEGDWGLGPKKPLSARPFCVITHLEKTTSCRLASGVQALAITRRAGGPGGGGGLQVLRVPRSTLHLLCLLWTLREDARCPVLEGWLGSSVEPQPG